MSIIVLGTGSSSSAVARIIWSPLVASSSRARNYASFSNVAQASVLTSAAHPGADAAGPSPSSRKCILPPSSCPAGTPMRGLSILKDGPELVAKPDEEYPTWLWRLISDAAMKTTSASIEAGTDSNPISSSAGYRRGTTRGDQRVRDKQEIRQLRITAALAAKKIPAPANLGGHGSQLASSGTVPSLGSREMLVAQTSTRIDQQDAAGSSRRPSPEEREQAERAKRRELRKINREQIKTRNFVGR